MILYLAQHGLCYDQDADPDRNLTPEGRLQIGQIARKAADAGVKVSVIHHSGKLRARQTADLFAEYLNAEAVRAIDGIGPTDDVEKFLVHMNLPDRSMIVGHLPFMERLTAFCLSGRCEPSIVQFQNAGVVCLERPDNKNWRLKWSLMPKMA